MNLRMKFISNLSYAYIAQMIAMLISIVMNLILPKFLGVESFSYWQLFIFYSQYIPFFHLGLNDGVYLRYGGITYEKLEKEKIKTQMILGMCYQFFFSVLICIITICIVNEKNRQWIILFACIYFMIYTVQNYLGYIFQAANETYIYSKSVIINRVSFLVGMLLLVVLKQGHCWPYIGVYIFAQLIAALYLCFNGREILCAPYVSFKLGFDELKKSISVGIKLMLANIASMLILGSGRFIIDIRWDLETFGRISFSITLTNFLLTFIQQIGMVLFPLLRQLKQDKQKQIYERFREVMFIVLPLIFVIYFPAKAILDLWLPNYSESFRYLALMLPICFFDAKMQMLCNTYLKVRRQEKLLFILNLISTIVSLCTGLLGAYVFNSLYVVVIGMVFSIALRSAVAEFYLAKQMNMNIIKQYVQEVVFVCIFIIVAWWCKNDCGFFSILACYICILITNRKLVIEWVKRYVQK